MREILFRGKTTSKDGEHEFNNVWVEGNLIISGDKYYIHPKSNRVRVEGELGKLIIMHEVVPETVGQYTELKDIAGNMVFTGDIVKLTEDVKRTFDVSDGVVKFHRSAFFVNGQNGIRDSLFALADYKYTLRGWVIGNIWDNPELVKEGT